MRQKCEGGKVCSKLENWDNALYKKYNKLRVHFEKMLSSSINIECEK